MNQHIVKVKSVHKITHDVLKIVTERPDSFVFISGQAAELSINKNGWKVHKNPFTFTSIPSDDYLEFTIKTYPSHKNVTKEMLHLERNDEIIIHEVFGAIHYQGEGVFIAGGAGVTPFISILRSQADDRTIGNNRLIFANKTKVDIINEQEFKKMLGSNFINILSDEDAVGYDHGQITKDYIRLHCGKESQFYYVCGPPPMMDAVILQLAQLNVPEKSIIKESF